MNDLASLYQVETKAFNQAVTRNIERFPQDFRFQFNSLKYSTSLPYAFTKFGFLC